MLTQRTSFLSIPVSPYIDRTPKTPPPAKKFPHHAFFYKTPAGPRPGTACSGDYLLSSRPMNRRPLQIVLIREGKIPPDRRVAFNPQQCQVIMQQYSAEIRVEPSAIRCFSDAEYRDAGITVTGDADQGDYYFGVKEVPVSELREGMTYFMFSHTIKKQPYNRDLLRTILAKRIRLIDYELITDDQGRRVVAFGHFAGVVGAHNALYTYGQRTGAFSLPRMKDLHDYAEALALYRELRLPPLRIVLTGTGRVGQGVIQVLEDMGIRCLSPEDYLARIPSDGPVYTILRPQDYARHKQGIPFDKATFYQDPQQFESAFAPFAATSDIFINAILWEPGAPAFFTLEEMRAPDFHIRVIADITCDIAPVTSVPATIKASTIQDPIFGFDPATGEEAEPFQPHVVDMMTIDNLPSELPRDAATAFGKQLMEAVVPELWKADSAMLERATIAREGELMPRFAYLADYVAGE